jgi:rhamnogalacturonan endolyase
MKKYLYMVFSLMLVWTSLSATPSMQMEKLTRGLIAMPAQDGGIFVSWRLLGTDSIKSTTFDLMRDGEVIVKNICGRTNFTDPNGSGTSEYQVVVKVDGVETEKSDVAIPWGKTYKVLQLDRPASGVDDVTGEDYTYTPNDCSVGDVDGDGEYEIIVQWQPSNKTDNGNEGKHPGNEFIDCYRLNGEKLWRIDMGVNILAGDQHTQFLVYDFDCDGKSEIIMRTAPGSKDGMGQYVNQAADDPTIAAADNHHDWRAPGSAALIGGQEYLTVFEGATGKALHTIYYNPNRDGGYGGAASGTELNWDDREGRQDYVATYGNRGNRFLAAVAYLDGPDKLPSAVMCRGYYTYSYLWAVDFDGEKLKHKWLHASVSKTQVELTDVDWNVTSRTYDSNTFGTNDFYTAYSQGNHNISVADVDGDGCDEIIYGGATIDNDGWLMYSTGLGHGDAIDVADIIPSRPGYEVFRCLEGVPYGVEMHDARTGEKIYYLTAHKDTGRSLTADISADYEGLEFWGSTGNYPRESASGLFEMFYDSSPSVNFRIYWDGDLQDELFDGSLDTETGIAHPNIMKWDGTTFVKTLIEYNGSQTCNWTKATPCLQADVMGDWREELFMWNIQHPAQLNIVASNIPSEYRVPTLMHDHLYRMGVAWQNVCYNQPPHLGYYLPAAKFSADDSATDLIDDIQIEHASAYYDLSGRALKGRPTCAGIYIYNNKKVIIK